MNNNNFLVNKYKKKVSVLLIFSFILSSFMFTYHPQRTAANTLGDIGKSILACKLGGLASSVLGKLLGAAGLSDVVLKVPVNDANSHKIAGQISTKECIMDGIANAVKRELVQEFVNKAVQWANGGATDSRGTRYGSLADKILRNTRDRLIDKVLLEDYYLKNMCTDFEIPIKIALQNHYYTNSGNDGNKSDFRYDPKCTLSERKVREVVVEKSLPYFWEDFLKVTTNTDNNAFANYFGAVNAIDKSTAKTQRNIETELDRNSGFLSYRKCDDEYIKNRKTTDFDGTDYGKKHCKVTTAGTTIANSLNKALGMEGDAIVAADEFDEIINQFISSFVDSLFNSDSGVSEFSSSGYAGHVADPRLDIYKEQESKGYLLEAYDIAIKIAESRKRTAKNVEKQHTRTSSCWNSKAAILNSGKQLFASKYISNEIAGYIELRKVTVDNAISQTSIVKTKFNQEIVNVDSEINELKSSKAKATKIQAAIRNAKSATELTEIMNKAGVTPADIEGGMAKKDKFDRWAKEVVNGKVVDYNRGGEVRKGGLVSSGNYCRTFIKEQDPNIPETDSYTPIVASSSSVSNVNSLPAASLVNVVDGYDPIKDLKLLEDSQDGDVINDDSDGDIENPDETGSVDCIAQDGSLSSGESASGMSYKDTSGICQSLATATCQNGTFSYVVAAPSIGGATPGRLHWLNSKTCGIKPAPVTSTTSSHATGQVMAGYSDMRLKKNIKAIKNPLEKVLKLSGVNFNWKDTGEYDLGVIAQNVEEVMPEIVHDMDTGYKAVDYAKLTALLIEAVKELKVENDYLRVQIEKIK